MIHTSDYARSLRAIGQALEVLHVEAFQMESRGDDYLVLGGVTLQLRYTSEEIDRLEREGQARRRDPNGMPDGRSMSQLMRAVGAYLNHKGARLLRIFWLDQSVSLAYETAQGRQELDVRSLSSMYKFWVRMCGNRTGREKKYQLRLLCNRIKA